LIVLIVFRQFLLPQPKNRSRAYAFGIEDKKQKIWLFQKQRMLNCSEIKPLTNSSYKLTHSKFGFRLKTI